MTEPNNLDQFFENCASTQAGSVTLKIRRFQAGDDSVTDELWESVLDQLRMRAAEILKNFQAISRQLEPDDLINSLYERLTRILTGEVMDIKNRSDFYKSASRNFVWHLRDQLKKKSHVHLPVNDDDGQPIDPISPGLGPSEKTEQEDLYLRALEEVDNLPDDLRVVFELRWGFAFTYREIEEAIGVPRETARKRWNEAKSALSRKLKP